MNKAILMGRLTKEPETKYTTGNKQVTSFTLAVDKRKKGEADFINCQAWEKTAELISKYVGKGDQIAAVGRIQTRSYDDNEGKKRYITEIVVEEVTFCGKKSDKPQQEQSEFFPMSEDDDELPFN